MDDFLNTHEGAAVPDGEAAAPHGIAYRSTADIARSGAGLDAAAAAKTIEQVAMEHCMQLPLSFATRGDDGKLSPLQLLFWHVQQLCSGAERLMDVSMRSAGRQAGTSKSVWATNAVVSL